MVHTHLRKNYYNCFINELVWFTFSKNNTDISLPTSNILKKAGKRKRQKSGRNLKDDILLSRCMLFSSSSSISRTSVCPPLSSCQSFPSAPWIDAVRNTYTDAALFLSLDNLFLRRSWHTLDETSNTWNVVKQDTKQKSKQET